jgi:hypothetical protein
MILSSLRALLSVFMVAAVFAILFAGSVFATAFLPHGFGRMARPLIPALAGATILIPALVGLLLGWALKRRGWLDALWPPRTLAHRAAVAALVAGYVLTAALGEPAVQTSSTSWEISEYKRLKATGSSLVWDAHPYLATYAAFPLAPGLILTYHEYQLDGLYGFGGYRLYLWYGGGVRTLAELPMWLS